MVVLGLLIIVIALTSATAAMAQGQCKRINYIQRNLHRVVDRIVPADEANYICTAALRIKQYSVFHWT
jgi:hypothetical protein